MVGKGPAEQGKECRHCFERERKSLKRFKQGRDMVERWGFCWMNSGLVQCGGNAGRRRNRKRLKTEIGKTPLRDDEA